MKHALAIVGLLLTAAPASAQSVLDQVPVETIVIRGSYRAIADCAFGRLDQVSGAGVRKVDLQNESRVTLDTGSVKYWELRFTPAGAERTRVAFSKVQTLFGAVGSNDVMPTVRACAL